MSTFSSDDVYEDSFDDEDVYDDPYEVVMYDIDDEAANDVYALLNMLTDSDRAWFAKRRLNVLAAAGPLSALVGRIIVDSLGRRWDPLLHPRDRFGRFIETGGFFRWLMNGQWTRGQVMRIDSDGVIHARSDGNDGIADGTPLKFNSKQASKLISTASDKASLSNDMPDFDAPIPDFPEASAAQRRVYNVLQFGDMPGEDLYIHRDPDMGSTDFGNEMTELVDRGLIQIDRGDKPRARRTDQDALGVLDMGDDEIGDVPDDETPDLDDSPALTKAQRDLYDRMVEMDSGEGDGIGPEELADVSDEDLDALIEAGVLDADGERYNLVNPEGDNEAVAIDETAEPELDAADAMDKAAQAAFPDDPDMQDAFIHHASELAFGDEYDGELPEDVRPAAGRRAKTAADAWWEEFNAPEAGGDAPVEDVPEAAESAPPVKRRSEYRAEAQDLLNQYEWPEDYLDSPEGEKYIQGVTDLLYAADLDEAGENDRAALNRQMAENKLRDIGISDEDIAGWGPEIEAFRNREVDAPEADVPEAEEVDVPEADVDIPEDIPEADVDINESDNPWEEYNRRIAEEPEPNFTDRLAQEQALADELGIDLLDEDGYVNWHVLADDIGVEEARELFDKHDGSVGAAMGDYMRRVEAGDVDAPEAVDDPWVEWNNRMREADLSDNFVERMRQERLFMDELGIDPLDDNGSNSWHRIDNEIGEERARELFDKHNGSVGDALADLEDRADAVDAPDPVSVNEVDEDFLNEGLDEQQAIEDALVPEADVPEANMFNGTEAPEIPEFDTGTPDAESPADSIVPGQVPESALVPSGDEPAFQRILDMPEFFEDKPDILQEGEVLDRAGNPVELGAWYKANRGGEGDPDQVVGFADQNKYPGWVFIQTPNGKMKMVLANHPDKRLAGLNRMPDPGTEARERIRVQRAVGGSDILNLDQNNPKNRLFTGEFAEVGMRVGGRGDVGKFQDGDEGIIVGFGWNAKTNTPIAHVVKANDPTRTKLALTPNNLVMGELTPPPPPTPEVPNDAPGGGPDANQIRPGVWGLPASDDEVVQLVNELGGGVDFVDFLNGFANPGAAHNNVQQAIDAGRLEIVPGEGPDGRAGLRVVGGDGVPATPDLPLGAEDAFEGDILNHLDGLGDVGDLRGNMIDIDDVDAVEKLSALRALVDRGVVEEFDNPDNGLRYFRRVPPTPDSPGDAENEVEADILSAIDNLDRPANRSDLLDPDGPDFDERMEAIRALVDRGVLRQSTDPATGKLVFQRRSASGSTPQSMSNEEAADALRSGADPLLIANDSLDDVLRAAGFRRVNNGQRGISDNEWVVGAQQGEFPIRVSGLGTVEEKVYMVKQSADESFMPNDVLNEVMAGAISADLMERLGRDDENGPLFHPRVGLAAAPRGVGGGAGGAIIMDHAAYAYPEGHELIGGHDVRTRDLQAGGASKDILKLAMFDYLINNTQDRHAKNQMFVRDPNTGQYRVVVIDNGFAFGAAEQHEGPANLSFSEYVRAWRPQSLIGRADRSNETEVRTTVQNFVDTYSNFDVESVMNRIRATYPGISPEQEEYVRKWMEVTSSRVQYMASNVDAVVAEIMNA